ncbi:uncharacterized protein LOC141713286 isoform X2 [Apium graveolens]|uniref:uncharacterized protein LOC141713286 isoform X2 n=1 Tax=Apium graveolens TaxID=4045 RepID=UPI003D7BA290
MMEFAKEIIVPTSNSNISRRQRELLKKFPGAIGALDGTLVHAIISADQQARYRARGRAHDSRILRGVALDPYSGFPVPPPNFRRQHALSKEEKFNHAHAKLRNVIERAYGVLKARFSILK